MFTKSTICAVLAAASALALSASAPASAAPTVQLDRECYVPDLPMELTGSGFSPGGDVTVLLNESGEYGNRLLRATNPIAAGLNGGLGAILPAPELASSDDLRERMDLLVIDQQRADAGAPPEETTAATDALLSFSGMWVDGWPNRVRPGKRTKIEAYGLGPFGKVLYVHYVRGGKLVKTVRVGALSGDCGDLKTTMTQFPFKNVRPGKWTVNFDTSKRWDPKAPGVRYLLKVRKARGASSAAITGEGPARKGERPSAAGAVEFH